MTTKGFAYEIKTEKSIERGENYFTVIAWGTKKLMQEWAEKFDALPDTVESKIIRNRDGEIIHRYVRDAKGETVADADAAKQTK